jgi:hypothetical protein
MKVLRLIRNILSQGYYKWALREVSPLHPDVPHITVRIRDLEDEARRIFA